MSDLTERLRDADTAYRVTRHGKPSLWGEAADRIEALEALNDRAMIEIVTMQSRINKLEALVNSLDIECMHPSMNGRHQCSIRANGRALSVEQWDTIMSCREGDDLHHISGREGTS